MGIADELDKRLEDSFGLPFDVVSELHFNEPMYLIRPRYHENSLFDISLRFQNQVRMIIELKPQTYSANMVRAMGAAEPENKGAFCAACKVMRKMGGRITFIVNGHPQSITDYSEWPNEWEQLSFGINLFPIDTTVNDEPDYPKLVMFWGPLFTGAVLSLLNFCIEQEENGEENNYEPEVEGNIKAIHITRYERSRINRMICLSHYGYNCQICGMNFESVYGDIGKGFIEVHHILPVSQMGENHIVDPYNDLIPVCPNCHAMLHRHNPPYSPEEIKQKLHR